MPINHTCEHVIKDYLQNERTRDELLNDEEKDALFLSLQNKRITAKAIRTLVKNIHLFHLILLETMDIVPIN